MFCTILVTVCSTGRAGPSAANYVTRSARHSVWHSRGDGFSSNPGQGEWIKLLRDSGFAVDALHELYASPDAPGHPHHTLADVR